jgi:hypothetical protein
MAGLNFDCDWRYAMNISPTQKARTGYLLLWNGIGGLNLTADLSVSNPYTSTGAELLKGRQIKCVGVMESFSFAGERDDPIRIACYVTTANASAIRAKIASGITTTKLKFSFAICDFDTEEQRWFESGFVQGGAKAPAVVDTMDGRLQLFIDATPTRIQPDIDISLCRFEFQGAPTTKESPNLQFATGAKQKVVKGWGGLAE